MLNLSFYSSLKGQNCDDTILKQNDTILQLNNTILQLNDRILQLNDTNLHLYDTILQLNDTILNLKDINGRLCEMVDCIKPEGKQLCPVTCKEGMLL